jgi:hypothetical protein
MTIEDIKTELREIIQLSDNATPAPWRTSQHDDHGHDYGKPVRVQSENNYDVARNGTPGCFLKDSDATLIATSRNLTPKMAKALLGVIEWLELYAIPTNEAQAQLENIRREWEVQA